MTISVGYTIADIAAIKALTPSQRTNGYARLCLSDADSKQSWYVFIELATDAADDVLILIPDDNPTAGRWFKTAANVSLGFTPEDVANKSTNTSLGTSDTVYPSQKAVKTYVDTVAATTVKTYVDTVAATKADKLLTTNRQTSSYTLVLADANKLVEMNSASANNLTIPPNADVAFSVGTQILISQYGAGQTSLVAGSGVTLRSDAGKLKISSRYSGATLIKIATNEWYLFGSLVA